MISLKNQAAAIIEFRRRGLKNYVASMDRPGWAARFKAELLARTAGKLTNDRQLAQNLFDSVMGRADLPPDEHQRKVDQLLAVYDDCLAEQDRRPATDQT